MTHRTLFSRSNSTHPVHRIGLRAACFALFSWQALPLYGGEVAPLAEHLPAPHDLSAGPYGFSAWAPEEPAETYPANMVFEQTGTQDPTLGTAMDGFWVLPYDLTSRSRVVGLGGDGVAFINTSNVQDHPDAGYLGSALVALDTRGEENIEVTWRAGTVEPNSRVYNLRLQYRIGDEGSFFDVVDDQGAPIEYQRNEVEGHTQVLGPAALPAEAEDRPLVQLRWKYYYTGIRLDPNSGQRSMLRIDEILVTSGTGSDERELVFEDFHPAGQADKPLIPVTVGARDPDGNADLTFEGEVTLSLEEGPGNVSGTLTRTASGGRAVFDDLVVDAPGEYRFRVESGEADPAVSGPMTVAAVTELIMPRYIQGTVPDNNDRVPFAYRLRIDGLQPNTTYRYGNRIEEEAEPPGQDGAGNMLFVFTDGSPFVRSTDAPDFAPDELGMRHSELTTDSEGSYTGWFVTEPTGNDRFVPGQNLRMRLLLNDGAGGEAYHFFLSTQSPVEIRGFGEDAGQGSALYGEASVGPRNFLLLYDNEAGEGRPVAGTVIEGTGAVLDERYAAFYKGQVAGRDGLWGTLIPNDLQTGIVRVEERSLLDGALLNATVTDEPVAATVLADHGPVPAYADLSGGPVFLPQDSDFWNTAGNWSTEAVPDGAGEKAIVHLSLDNDREVSLGQDITIGEMVLSNDTASRNRFVGAGGGLTFQGAGPEEAVVRVGGTGTGFNEFAIAEGMTLDADLRVVIDTVNPAGEYGALRIRESLSGPGGLLKEGLGVLSLTGGGKTYAGETSIAGGVLRVTESSVPANTSGVSVSPGGQLRLVSHGPGRTYTFGGDLTLDSMGPDEVAVTLPQGGRLGGLRLDPELELRNSTEDVHEGTVTNNIAFAGDSHVHVDGSSNQLTLSGDLSGPGALFKSGGGTLLLSGNNALYGGGTRMTTGTVIVEPGSALGTGPLEMVADGGSEVNLFLNNAVQTVSRLQGDLDDTSSLTVTLASNTLLDVVQEDESRFQGALAGAGSLLKRGDGILELTRGPNTLAGTVTVEGGVLALTESSQPGSTSRLEVGAGGQVRLGSSGTRNYTFGSGPLHLAGTGIDPARSASKGAFRQEGSEATDIATVTNDIVLSGETVGIHANRDVGDGSTLILSGAISGETDLFKTGGGTLTLTGDNAALTGGTIIENGRVVVGAGSRLGGGGIAFTDPDRERRLELRNASQTVTGLTGEVAAAEGGTLELFLAANHHLTVEQAAAGVFEGGIEGSGSLTKTGPATWVLSGVSSFDGSVAVAEGVLRVDGSLANPAQIFAAAGARVEGTGVVSTLAGLGTVAPGAGLPGVLEAVAFDPVVAFDPAEGLGAAFVFSATGPAPSGEPVANDLLRLTGTEPFGGDLGEENAVDIFLDVPSLSAGDVFHGGFFAENGEVFDSRIENADFRFHLRDSGGETVYRGTAYRSYPGPLVASIDTVAENGGRVMRITWEGSSLYSDWAEAHFADPGDAGVAGPEADPDGDGVDNLMEYALGQDPLAASHGGLPEIEHDGTGAAIVFARNPDLTDIAYIVEASSDVENWDEVLYDSRVDSQENNLGERMRIEDPVPAGRRFLRLRVIMLE